ncbi:helix-turn-helix domain-containing protein [Thalassospira lucentensis]|uniref:helix-turn-helix domain-containing protein n=1 Tax=Thalassospira lucentensis TaxID=168935 RepID=UPI003AA9CAC0
MQFSLRQYQAEAASHNHTDCHQIIISDLGLLEMEIEGRGGQVRGTKMAFVPAGDTHAYRAEGLNRFLVLDVDIAVAQRTGIEKLWRRNANASPYLQMAVGRQAVISDLFHVLSKTMRDGNQIRLPSRVGDCGAMIDDLTGEDGIVYDGLRRILSGTSAALTTSADDWELPGVLPSRLQRVLDWANVRMADPITVGDMAAVAVQSESSFFVSFQRYLGTTPMRWLTEQRLLAARQLLLGSDDHTSIGVVASQVGFTDQSAFSRAFSRRFGHPPVRTLRQLPDLVASLAVPDKKAHKKSTRKTFAA